MKSIRTITLILFFLSFPAFAQVNGLCDCAIAQIDPKIEFPTERCKESGLTDLSDEDAVEVMGCLLEQKGKKHYSRLLGAVLDERMSRSLGRPTVEVAALYQISRFYYGNSKFAWAILLESNRDEEDNSKKVIRRAYQSYRRWLEQARKIGLKETREKGLDPLAGSDVRWYRREIPTK